MPEPEAASGGRRQDPYDSLVGAILNTAVEGILTIDERGMIESFNPAAERIFGYEAAEVLGRSVNLLMPSPYCEEHDGYIANYLATGDKKIIGIGREVQGLRKNGEIFPIDLAVSEVELDGRRIFTGFVRDITQLKEAQGKALHAERLAAIGEMVAGLGHESRNALQRSQAFLEALALRVADQPETLDLVRRVQATQRHLHQLYEDLRGYAAPLNLERQPCEIHRLWRSAWADLEVRREDKQIELQEETGGVDLECRVDPFLFGQVFRNIFDNAIDACGDRGRVVVECTAGTGGAAPLLQIAVHDDGCGLTEEQRERIFEPFFTNKKKGTGLGMAIVKRILEAHGGRIEAGTGPAGGARVLLSIPCDRP